MITSYKTFKQITNHNISDLKKTKLFFFSFKNKSMTDSAQYIFSPNAKQYKRVTPVRLTFCMIKNSIENLGIRVSVLLLAFASHTLSP